MGKNPRISPLLLPVFLTNQPQKPGYPIASFAMGAPALRLCFCLFFPPTSHKSPGAPSRTLRWVGITDPSLQQRHCFSSPASTVLSATHRIGRVSHPSHRKGTRSRVPKKAWAKGPTPLPKAGAKPEGRSDSIYCLCCCRCFFFRVFRPKIACQAPKTT